MENYLIMFHYIMSFVIFNELLNETDYITNLFYIIENRRNLQILEINDTGFHKTTTNNKFVIF